MDPDFYAELKNLLPGSKATDRKKWVLRVIQEGIPIKDLAPLLDCGEPVTSRFLWLLSELGEIDTVRLRKALPDLMNLLDPHAKERYAATIANFWILAGVPDENEAEAIDLLFRWLRSINTNVTTKSRSMTVLLKLCQKYPDLKNELRLSIEDQVDKYTADFRKRSEKILSKLD